MDNAERLRADIRVLTALIEAAPGDSRNDLTLKVCVDMLRERKRRLQQIGRCGRSLTSPPPTEEPSGCRSDS